MSTPDLKRGPGRPRKNAPRTPAPPSRPSSKILHDDLETILQKLREGVGVNQLIVEYEVGRGTWYEFSEAHRVEIDEARSLGLARMRERARLQCVELEKIVLDHALLDPAFAFRVLERLATKAGMTEWAPMAHQLKAKATATQTTPGAADVEFEVSINLGNGAASAQNSAT